MEIRGLGSRSVEGHTHGDMMHKACSYAKVS